MRLDEYEYHFIVYVTPFTVLLYLSMLMFRSQLDVFALTILNLYGPYKIFLSIKYEGTVDESSEK